MWICIASGGRNHKILVDSSNSRVLDLRRRTHYSTVGVFAVALTSSGQPTRVDWQTVKRFTLFTDLVELKLVLPEPSTEPPEPLLGISLAFPALTRVTLWYEGTDSLMHLVRNLKAPALVEMALVQEPVAPGFMGDGNNSLRDDELLRIFQVTGRQMRSFSYQAIENETSNNMNEVESPNLTIRGFSIAIRHCPRLKNLELSCNLGTILTNDGVLHNNLKLWSLRNKADTLSLEFGALRKWALTAFPKATLRLLNASNT
ncbi:hypothetical protein CC1G_11856 [Coprinopsis cinerea okayama7|uniref:Uncharacterized protein n=1 Tax=Coprinopsis cinerea (strain Okayama-7 / 130 / ATCC MYA-4618 / FGSC 9003) TaxID=240176 RepID=A8PH29_COPC7|nr:hypothetical protein CC1G_11856 [Coprinopsis cinerea okayama7\|eukprot:XP_001841328.2 hypothetical protein CC1G_11856 [Coprinopsis cinerea okayama7\